MSEYMESGTLTTDARSVETEEEWTGDDWGDADDSEGVEIVDGEIRLEAIQALPDDPIAHYDATELDGYDDGDDVSEWLDQSGNGHDLEGSATYVEEGINGEPALEFTGSRLTLADGDPLLTTDDDNAVTFIAVMTYDGESGTSSVDLPAGQGGEDNHDFAFRKRETADQTAWFSNDKTVDIRDGTGDRVTGTFIQVGLTDDENALFRQNGHEIGTSTGTSVTGSHEFHVGGPSDTGRRHNGLFSQVLVYNRTLSDDEIGDAEAELSEKWGIDLE